MRRIKSRVICLTDIKEKDKVNQYVLCSLYILIYPKSIWIFQVTLSSQTGCIEMELKIRYPISPISTLRLFERIFGGPI